MLKILTPTKNTKITLHQRNNKIVVNIKHNYGEYLDTDLYGREILRNNTAYEQFIIDSVNMSYAKRRALNYFSKYF